MRVQLGLLLGTWYQVLGWWCGRRLRPQLSADQISAVPHPHPLPPHALGVIEFPFPHLAALAGRAPIGGAREVALACFVAARLAAEQALDGEALAPTARAERSAGAKTWLGTLTIPAAVRTPLARCVDATATGASSGVARELAALSHAAAPYLDPPSRAELDSLAAALSVGAVTVPDD